MLPNGRWWLNDVVEIWLPIGARIKNPKLILGLVSKSLQTLLFGGPLTEYKPDKWKGEGMAIDELLLLVGCHGLLFALWPGYIRESQDANAACVARSFVGSAAGHLALTGGSDDHDADAADIGGDGTPAPELRACTVDGDETHIHIAREKEDDERHRTQVTEGLKEPLYDYAVVLKAVCNLLEELMDHKLYVGQTNIRLQFLKYYRGGSYGQEKTPLWITRLY